MAKVIAIDVDGTLLTQVGQKGAIPPAYLGEWLPDAKEAMRLLKSNGFTIRIMTGRIWHGFPNWQEQLALLKCRFEDDMVPYDSFESKVGDATVFIDDLAIPFLNNWGEIVRRLVDQRNAL